MDTSLRGRRPCFIVFLLGAALLYCIGISITLCAPENVRSYSASVALPFDLMVVIPAMFYFFVIRKQGTTPLLVLPVIWLGGFVVMQVVQPENLQFVLVLTAGALVVEVAIAVREISRLVKAFMRAVAASADPAQWFAPAFFEITRSKVASKLAGLELTTLYYALFSWRKKPLVSDGAIPFSYHKESGYLAFMAVMIALAPFEIVGLHLLISAWNPMVALVITILSIYSMFWLVGDCRASLLRPITISRERIVVNSGIRFSADIPLDSLSGIGTAIPNLPKNEMVNLGVMRTTNCWLLFNQGIETETIVGTTKTIKALGLSIDNVASFRKTLAEEVF